MFEDTYVPPVYLDLYNFEDGPQDDIFLDSYAFIPTPSPNQDLLRSISQFRDRLQRIPRTGALP